MKEKLVQLSKWFSEKGIPIPYIREPKTGQPSVSLTLVVISSGFVMLGLLGKFAKVVDGVDMQSALYWAFGCYSLYFGRKLSGDGKKLEIESKEGDK